MLQASENSNIQDRIIKEINVTNHKKKKKQQNGEKAKKVFAKTEK